MRAQNMSVSGSSVSTGAQARTFFMWVLGGTVTPQAYIDQIQRQASSNETGAKSHPVLEGGPRQGRFQAIGDRFVHQTTVRLGPEQAVHLPLLGFCGSAREGGEVGMSRSKLKTVHSQTSQAPFSFPLR